LVPSYSRFFYIKRVELNLMDQLKRLYGIEISGHTNQQYDSVDKIQVVLNNSFPLSLILATNFHLKSNILFRMRLKICKFVAHLSIISNIPLTYDKLMIFHFLKAVHSYLTYEVFYPAFNEFDSLLMHVHKVPHIFLYLLVRYYPFRKTC
jgi:hypothetical protein